jgi:ribonucleoside-diphosphate reductase alpha chain
LHRVFSFCVSIGQIILIGDLMSALQELQNYTFVSKYARWLEKENRRETWKEAVDRVRNMMHTKYASLNIGSDIDWAYDIMHKKKVLGSQRALQFGGEPILKRHAKIYNCTSSYCDRLRFFQECFWLLLCGSGTGFSVQKHHIAKLPSLSQEPKSETGKKYVIEDSIEGWADALGVLLSSYFTKPSEDKFKDYKDQYIVFDYSNIREKGSSLSSGVGKAPGFEPLQNGLEKIRTLLDRCLANGQKKLRPIDAYDIIMHSSDAVLSGGVRRSASLALFSHNDVEMAKAKTGNWYMDNPQRARSNNSALLLKDETTFDEFQILMDSVKEFGEPGFIWSDSTEMTFNPCVEVGMWPVDEETGRSGWQGCNLSTINCSSVTDESDFYERCKAAATIGTLQAGFTNLEYLGEISQKIFQREALLGVSLTGIMEKHDIVLTEKVLKNGAKIAVDTNKELAKKIGINQAARVTCLKPEGTSSSMLGTSSGIHPHHAKRYIRHVQANVLEAPYQHFKKVNPQACEKSSWSANNTDEVVKFPIEVPDGAKLKNQLPAVEMLSIVKDTQKNWVYSGKNRSLCTQSYLSHNVSNTVTVKPDEWIDVTKYIYDNRRYFAGISLIPQSGDKDYIQAPFTTVYTSREIVKEYGDAALWCSGLIELALNVFDNNLWAACDYVTMNQAKENDTEDRLKFITKMKNFAGKYFNSDVKRLTYCMKDVYNWKIYCDLFDSFKKVDYTQLLETEDNTLGIEEISCAGGACLI